MRLGFCVRACGVPLVIASWCLLLPGCKPAAPAPQTDATTTEGASAEQAAPTDSGSKTRGLKVRPNVTAITGRWGLVLTQPLAEQNQQPAFRDVCPSIMEFEPPATGKVIATMPQATAIVISDVKIEGPKIKFGLKLGEQAGDFEGELVDGVVRGSLQIPALGLIPAMLRPTDETTYEGWDPAPLTGGQSSFAEASKSKDQPAAILDGNVIRVLTRLHALGGDPKSVRVNQRLWSLAEELVSIAATHGSAGNRPAVAGACSALNQSLMELGATLCTPRDPQCERCPVSAECRARLMDRTDSYPEPSPRAPILVQRKVVAVVNRSGRYLVRQRAQEGINGGFWEFPERDLNAGESPVEIAAAWLRCPISALLELKPLQHSITRYRIHLSVFQLRIPAGSSGRHLGTCWATVEELAELALTAAHRRIARQLSS